MSSTVVNAARKRATLRDTLLTQTLNAIFQNVDSIGMGVILMVAGQAMLSGELTVGDLVLFIYYLDMFSWFSVGLGWIMTAVSPGRCWDSGGSMS